MRVYGKNLRISPKKMRVIAEVVRGQDAQEALDFLRFAPKKGAKILYGVLHSALENAVHNDSQKIEDLKISSLIVSKGIVFKRGNPVSRGRMNPILKRTSNVKLELQVK